MACYSPIQGFRGRDGKVTFKPPQDTLHIPATVSCGQCSGCRLEHSRQWATRIVHELRDHDASSFVTLTYDDANLPPGRSLDLNDWRQFAKRLRRACGKFRYFHVGEYGEELDQHGITKRRPHLHAILFGLDFRHDRQFYKFTKHGDRLDTSPTLEEIWKKGFCPIGDVTFKSAAYVARYCMKKINGPQKDAHYQTYDPATGEWLGDLKPEYTTMSRRPGLGKNWYTKYTHDTYKDDYIVLNGKKLRPPKYYDKLLQADDHDLYQDIKEARRRTAQRYKHNNTPERLAVREQVHQAQLEMLKRNLK